MLVEKEATAESFHSSLSPNVARNNAEEPRMESRPARERPLARRLVLASQSLG